MCAAAGRNLHYKTTRAADTGTVYANDVSACEIAPPPGGFRHDINAVRCGRRACCRWQRGAPRCIDFLIFLPFRRRLRRSHPSPRYANHPLSGARGDHMFRTRRYRILQPFREYRARAPAVDITLSLIGLSDFHILYRFFYCWPTTTFLFFPRCRLPASPRRSDIFISSSSHV